MAPAPGTLQLNKKNVPKTTKGVPLITLNALNYFRKIFIHMFDKILQLLCFFTDVLNFRHFGMAKKKTQKNNQNW